MVRRKQRYILFKIRFLDEEKPPMLDKDKLLRLLAPPFREMFGEYGAGCVIPTLSIVLWMPEKNVGVFRIVRDWVDNYKLMLDEIQTIESRNVEIVVPHVSGTIDQAQKWIDENPTKLD